MAFLLKKELENNCVIGFWEMNEAEEELKAILNNGNENIHPEVKKAAEFKNPKRRKEWLSARVLLKELTGSYSVISYDQYGKPLLDDKKYQISVSHSNNYLCLILSKEKEVGVDIEFVSDKIARIALKFLHDEEMEQIDKNSILELYLHWCAKETLYKLHGKGDLDFKNNIFIEPFNIDQNKSSFRGIVTSPHGNKKTFDLFYFTINDYVVVWACK